MNCVYLLVHCMCASSDYIQMDLTVCMCNFVCASTSLHVCPLSSCYSSGGVIGHREAGKTAVLITAPISSYQALWILLIKGNP